MKLTQIQRNVYHQKLIMTEELKQSLNVLEMSLPELKSNIEKELDENPLLDIVPEHDNIDYEEISDKNNIPVLKDLISSYYIPPSSHSYKSENDFNPLDAVAKKTSLKDHLMEQLYGVKADSKTVKLCKYIIENIDHRGYLGCSLEEISKDLNISTDTALHALKLVQTFHPSGIAARNLKECLLIQLKARPWCSRMHIAIVQNWLEFVAENKIKKLAENLNTDIKTAADCCQMIRSLEPKPSRGFYTNDDDCFIIPDAFIISCHGNLKIFMNDSALPELKINKLYKQIIDAGQDNKACEYINDKFKKAVGLINSISQRNKTIYTILELLLEKQNAYFKYGKNHMVPMKIEDIANASGFHESTISRAIKGKYISTPFGTVEIRKLFSTGLKSYDNTAVSSLTIKQEIKTLIANENKYKPLSDANISNILKLKCIEISRRTVAKYREQMNISPSSKRKMY